MRDLIIPDLGEGVDEGTVIAVHVAVGDRIERDQSVLEVETDKVTLEIPSALAGVIREVCVAPEAQIRPGDVFARLDTETAEAGAHTGPGIAQTPAGEPPAAPASPPATTDTIPPGAPPVIPDAAPNNAPTPPPGSAGALVRAGPAARREARQLGVDIATVPGTGRRGVITKADVRQHVRARLAEGGARTAPAAPPLPDLGAFGPVRREACTRIEQATAKAMTRAASTVPHAWVTRYADVSALEQARRAFRRAQPGTDAPLTMTAVLCRVLALTLRRFPRFNAALDAAANELVLREYVHVGVAVDTPRGLLVPVIRNAADLSIGEIAVELHTLSEAARTDTLDGAALRGAGMTITNLGGLGVNGIQPIVNWPEVAILGVAALEEHAARTTEGTPEWRLRLPLTLGFDHRVINGADAARFLESVAGLLAEPVQLAFFR